MPKFIVGLLKLLLASMVVGALMNLFGLSAEALLGRVGLTPAELWEKITLFIAWAIPNILLGSLVILPIWFFTYLFLPPRNGYDD